MGGQDKWKHLAAQVIARRQELGMSTRQVLADHTGLNYRVLGDLERGTRGVSAGTLAIVEQALGWMPGSARRVLEGGEPVTTDRLVTAVSAAVDKTSGSPATQGATAIRGLSEAYGIAAELTERGDATTGNRLLQALARIGRGMLLYSDDLRGPDGALADGDQIRRQTLPPERWPDPDQPGSPSC
ncbi:helix-turn-helix transcriptional regulator [Nocardia puris]|nr:helix-turn-helix transcriptional regulator [Nocardia puris]MBF6462532.1 helix-turn-helix transcriptional regulator [Nocardia puris]